MMNKETVFELVNQIADDDKVSPFMNGMVSLTEDEIVRFAELIVRKCVHAVYDDGQDAEYYQNRILNKLGVEE